MLAEDVLQDGVLGSSDKGGGELESKELKKCVDERADEGKGCYGGLGGWVDVCYYGTCACRVRLGGFC